ncbi:MAG: VOC family protein [Actinomycetota bacterium]|nr:VOC family protein [Actinomycetota bacterium]
MPDETVNVRYMVDDVAAAVAFYTTHLGFTEQMSSPAFADVRRGQLRLLLSGPQSSAGRPMPDGAQPAPGGWNRIHLIVADLSSEVDRLGAEGVRFRNDVVTGPGGSQILIEDPSGNLVELFQPAS